MPASLCLTYARCSAAFRFERSGSRSQHGLHRVISGVGRERGSCPYGRQPASLRLSPAQPGDFAIVSIFWPYGFFLGGDRSCNGTRPDHSKNRIRNGVVDSQTAKGDTMWLAIIQPAAAAAVARNGEGPPTDATDIKPPQTRFRGRSQALLYNRWRPHRSLGQAVPCGEARLLPRQACRKIVAEPVLGGLHHIYRVAA